MSEVRRYEPVGQQAESCQGCGLRGVGQAWDTCLSVRFTNEEVPTPGPAALEGAKPMEQADPELMPARNVALFEVRYIKILQYWRIFGVLENSPVILQKVRIARVPNNPV